MTPDLLHFLTGVAGVLVGLTIIDVAHWFIWGRHESVADQAREARLLALALRVQAVSTRAHDGYMEGNVQASELAYNVAELADALQELAEDLSEV
jgi:hypothetical protein